MDANIRHENVQHDDDGKPWQDMSTPENIVSLPDSEPTKAQVELEAKRAQQIAVEKKAREIVMRILDRDAAGLEKAAFLHELTLQRRHDLMNLAWAVRRVMLWLSAPYDAIDGPQRHPAEPEATP